MFLLYLIAAIVSIPVAIIILRIWRKGPVSGDNKVSNSLGAVAAGAVATFVITMFASIPVGRYVPTLVKQDFSVQLVAMKSGEATTGTFVWGTGRIDGSLYYLVYVKNVDGSMTPYKITADNTVRIIEDDNLENSGTWTGFNRVADKTSSIYKWTFDAPRDRTERNELHVPRGTVRQSFSAN